MSSILPAYRTISAPDAEPSRTAFVLHGILGSGKNWRSFAKRLALAHPDWRFVLVDQRNHGETGQAPAPHGLVECAADLARLAQHVGQPELLIGHSFGGKVALVYGSAYRASLRHLWVLDACPGPRRGTPGQAETNTDQLFAFLSSIDKPIAGRAALSAQLETFGVEPMVADWLATNLRPLKGGGQSKGYGWRFFLPGVEAMMRDYYAADLWEAIEAFRPPIKVHLLRAGRSGRWSAQDLQHLDRASNDEHVVTHVIEDSGHWVHVDAPEVLFSLLSDSLVEPTLGVD